MPLLLILEDTLGELRTVAESARRAGFDEFEISERVIEARIYLEKAMAGKVPLSLIDTSWNEGFSLESAKRNVPSSSSSLA
jgi:hypothetical protein